MTWKRLSSKVIYDNPWMTVLEDRVVHPGGGETDYGHVRFKNRAVAILPLDDDDNTWLVGQHRYTLDAYSWELPMGGAPAGESPLSAAKRELKEETGLTAENWSQLMFLHTTNSITDEEGYVFIARGLEEGEPDFYDDEVLEIRKLPLAEAIEMARSGEITDAMSVATLLRIRTD